MKRKFLCLLFILLIGLVNTSVQAKEISSIKTYKLEKKQLDHVYEIAVDLRYMDLEIKPSKDQHTYLSYQLHCKNKKNPFTYSIKDHVLSLKEGKWKGVSWKKVSPKEWKQYRKEYNQYSKNMVTLYIPAKSTLKKSTVTINDGNLNIKNFHCDNIDLNSKYGDMEISDSVFDVINMQTGDGNISIKDIKAFNAVAITAKYGDIDISNVQTRKGIEIETSDGDINFKDIRVLQAAAITTKYGDINTSNVQVKKGIKIKTSDGDVSIESMKALEEVYISSYYGDITIADLDTPKDIQVKGNDGDIEFQIKKAQLKTKKIIMDTRDGSLSVPSKLLGDTEKKKVEDGWHYERNINSEKTLLKITTKYGDILLKQ